jgi:transposase-like protein
MARKAVVDRDVVLDMLKEGKTTQEIANKFGVSRQAIDLHRKDFISNGLLHDQRAPRTRTETREAPPPERDTVSLDEQIDLVIKAFGALKRLPKLEAELETCQRQYEDAAHEIRLLRDAEQRRQNQERRWHEAQQH